MYSTQFFQQHKYLEFNVHLFIIGFDVETRLKGGWTPLMYACENGSFSIVQLLITKGANCNSHKGTVHEVSIQLLLLWSVLIDTFTPLMCLSSCKSLSFEDDLVSCAKLLIEEGARVNARDRYTHVYTTRQSHARHVTIIITDTI